MSTIARLPQIDMAQQTHPALANTPILSGEQSGWNGIFFHHYDHPDHESPAHQWTQHVIGITGRGGHPGQSDHWVDGQIQTPESNVIKKSFKLNLGQKNWVLSFHIGFAALWTGTVLSMFLIALRNQDTANADILFALNWAINLLDDFIVIPAAIGSVVTATVLCWQTNYGFFKFYWVITKWILTTGLMMFGTFWLFPWGNTAENIALSEGLNAFKNPIYLFDARGVLIGSLIQISFLFFIIAISTLKPWGRRLSQQPKRVEETATLKH